MTAAAVVMPMGDSITHGYDPVTDGGVPTVTDVGYRQHLDTLLAGQGYSVRFVGSQAAGNFANNQHEGHPGWFISQLTSLADDVLPIYRPDVILLMIGTNDMFANLPLVALADLGTLLDAITALLPNVTVLLSPIPPISRAVSTYAADSALIYNTALPQLLLTRPNVLLVGAGTTLTTADLPDGVHPTTAGYNKLGDRWYPALADVLGPATTSFASTAPAMPERASYSVHAVWGTGTDADTSQFDDLTERYLRPPGLVIDGIGRSEVRAFAPPGTPALDYHLSNHDGLFSPGGTLGGFVGRGPVTYVGADWTASVPADDPGLLADDPWLLADGGVNTNLFYGWISTAPQDVDRSAPARVQIRALGQIARLQRVKPVIALQENIRTDQWISLVLQNAGWAVDEQVLDVGATTLLYAWGDGTTTAAALIEQALAAEGVPACAYEAYGTASIFHFEGRNFRANSARSSTVMWSLTDTLPHLGLAADDPGVVADDPDLLADGASDGLRMHVVPSQWAANPDEVVDVVSASVNVRTPTSTQKVWEYGSALTLGPAETLEIPIQLSDPFKAAVVPVAATDYTVSAGALASVTLSAVSGVRTTLTLVADVGGATVLGVTSNGIQLRAVSLPATQQLAVVSTVDTSQAAARYEPKPQTIALWPEIARNEALDRVNTFARRYQYPRDQMTVQVVGIDRAHLYMILSVRVSDRVRVRHTHGGIDAEFFVESFHHDLSAGGGLHRLTLNLELVTSVAPARFGTAQLDIAQFAA